MAAETYRLILQGHLDSDWSAWFDGLTIMLADNGETILTGPIVDQTALHGILIKIRDVGLPLLALARIDPERDDGHIDATNTQRYRSSERIVH